ncbi:hypothetical protein BO94DRAFT_553573 [Aspergillus sclerotioniger CBS 115572]|uniref:BZIP domain-containing protein n=1 Tax=Aspergillus sclerotioniger CBS 115572 TaxID=1450535 RepID=A0A317X7V1_9EURO|nr:hypothetical protein BO94DRAFT_553573 [Aspergillus sclerotioniger CBS 115572]PWY94684.1 hypothetical protein BO94DRAFT_553573 [Aspergillus sclerotioniger CBS 115572]
MVLSTNPGGVDEKRQRKKLQNRKNQRARRLRIKKEQHEEPDRRPYNVHRWRLEEYEAPHSTSWKLYSSQPSPQETHGDEKHIEHHIPSSLSSSTTTTPSKTHIITSQQEDPKLPFPADNLLHLIYYNVFWGFFQNKVLLSQLTMSLIPGPQPIQIVHQGNLFPLYNVIIPTTPNIPNCLVPTQSQENFIHCSWIDFIPFPRIRENLITWEANFDHAEFVEDLIGCLVDGMTFPAPSSDLDPAATGSMVLTGGEDDEITAARKGLIIWGEPHRAESWEATPGFLRKWSWAVEGCDELIEFSNRWRVSRGEEPMRVSLCV